MVFFIPPKLKDHGSFSIPCVMGEMSFENALCDLEVGELKPTNNTLQLVTILSSILHEF